MMQKIKNEDVKAVLRFITAGYFYDVLTKISEENNGYKNKYGCFDISDREKDMLKLVADGLTSDDIAKVLYMSKATVENKIEEIFQKLENKERTKAASYTINNTTFSLS